MLINLRNSVDAILVGANTALIDNPTLNVRCNDLFYIEDPYKFIIGRELELFNDNCNLFSNFPDKTYLITDDNFNLARKKKLQDQGINFLEISKKQDGFFDLNDLLTKLGELNITSLLVEGGGITLAKFLDANLINQFYCYIAPKFIAERNAKSPFVSDMAINCADHIKQAQFINYQSFRTRYFINR
ncbi:MAG: RibD family protein [Candidatus Rickettsia vulgarisii]